MTVDHIRYDILARDALRGIVRTVLEDAAKSGLPGEHHFYITFDTRAEGVVLSQRLRAQYPADVTIVLQHQFWDLTVSADAFEVGLTFGGVPERLTVPFAAVTGFLDPSVPFELRFEPVPEGTEEASTAAEATTATAKPISTLSKRPPAQHKQTTTGIATAPTPANPPSGSTSDAGPDKPGGGGEIVRLDRFRKK
jgi:hypothetical protein